MFRKMLPHEKEYVYKMGFSEWGEDLTWEEYVAENEEEDGLGTRYVLTINKKIVSSVFVMEFPFIDFHGIGFGSLITNKKDRGQGYGLTLLQLCMEHFQQKFPNSVFMLYSDVPMHVYERIGFLPLPTELQYFTHPPLMAYYDEDKWNKIIQYPIDCFPSYF